MSDLEFPLKCAVCGKPASCFGRYEDQTGPVEPACDECCGHGCEDGWCVQIDYCSDLIAEFANVRAELEKARLLVQRLDSENTQYCGKLADCKRELDKARELYRALQKTEDPHLQWSALVQRKQWLEEQLTLAREELVASEVKRKELVEALEHVKHDLDQPEKVHPRSQHTLSMATQQFIREALANAATKEAK